MKTILSALGILFLISSTLTAQLFTAIPVSVSQLGNSSAAWGDYDHDGDLDLALAGELSNTSPVIKIYQNVDGDLLDINASLEGLSDGSAEWGDYDGDGDLDLLVTGRDDLLIAASRIFRNDDGTFVDSGIELPGVMGGEASWGDYDNDGDLDILMAGAHEGLQFLALILKNEGNNQFTDLEANLPGVQSASIAWVDYNNDGQPDVMVNGDSGGGMITRLFKQENGTFTEVNIDGFTGLSYGDFQWGDLDNDGDMDLVAGGSDIYLDGRILLYENEGNDQFTEHLTLNNNITSTSLDLGDFNNDGWLDIILSGKIVGCGGEATTMLFRNESFFNFFIESALIPGYRQGDVSWGDFDNNGYTDLVFTGMDGFGVPKTHIYSNDFGLGVFNTNTPPEMPEGLTASTSGNSVILSWEKAIDSKTPSKGLSYNLYVGTATAFTDVVSPNSNQASGIRNLASLGNTSQDTSWTITNLDDGDYYWSVQAIDNGFMGSSFSPEQSFTINAVGIHDINNTAEFSIFPNPVENQLTIKSNQSERFNIRIYSSAGKLILSTELQGPISSIDVTSLPLGIYLVNVLTKDHTWSSKFIKK